MIHSLGAGQPRKVLVISEGRNGPAATQRISFGQPFAPSDGDAQFAIFFASDRPESTDVAAEFANQSPDVLVLSRCTTESGAGWIAAAREVRIPVIFHIDDDLLSVPSSLGQAKFKAYNDPARLAALRANIEASDLLYVSTAALAERFNGYGIGTPIIAGDIYCSVSVEEIGELIPPATGPVMGYMGTSGHADDLASILPAICEVMNREPSLQFESFGTIKMPTELLQFGRRVRHLPAVANYDEFTAKLRSLGWWIGLAPLEDNEFNRCKADTKWVEYSLAGMAVVASDLPLYERACSDGAGFLAGSTEQWTDACLQLLNQPRLRADMVEAAQSKLRDCYSHARLREQVTKIFQVVLQPT